MVLLFTAIVCIGMADAGYNTQIDILIGRYFPFTSDAAFAGFYSTQSFTSGMGFLVFLGLSYAIPQIQYFRLTQALILLTLMGGSFISLFFLNRRDPIEKKS
ncbi:hypothetical protein EIN_055870 [Entamoeba invadens IP1]|uniref:hypothetical protein n=1 Tax=Entamoeba invadens IP1 TaxID=370355 RepID=UPI0002C3E42D|nr:hypothetical protein EIN_055870 [Entamoeba invadens IP1]ELP93232.1 hypothetical protein EIN_055870 [Entamoeba invadens IP1]|eukprot:XP_004260003.1 hypothetical protein EIN_055870 [Entamoeba invadens IP1]